MNEDQYLQYNGQIDQYIYQVLQNIPQLDADYQNANTQIKQLDTIEQQLTQYNSVIDKFEVLKEQVDNQIETNMNKMQYNDDVYQIVHDFYHKFDIDQKLIQQLDDPVSDSTKSLFPRIQEILNSTYFDTVYNQVIKSKHKTSLLIFCEKLQLLCDRIITFYNNLFCSDAELLTLCEYSKLFEIVVLTDKKLKTQKQQRIIELYTIILQQKINEHCNDIKNTMYIPLHMMQSMDGSQQHSEQNEFYLLMNPFQVPVVKISDKLEFAKTLNLKTIQQTSFSLLKDLQHTAKNLISDFQNKNKFMVDDGCEQFYNMQYQKLNSKLPKDEFGFNSYANSFFFNPEHYSRNMFQQIGIKKQQQKLMQFNKKQQMIVTFDIFTQHTYPEHLIVQLFYNANQFIAIQQSEFYRAFNQLQAKLSFDKIVEQLTETVDLLIEKLDLAGACNIFKYQSILLSVIQQSELQCLLKKSMIQIEIKILAQIKFLIGSLLPQAIKDQIDNQLQQLCETLQVSRIPAPWPKHSNDQLIDAAKKLILPIQCPILGTRISFIILCLKQLNATALDSIGQQIILNFGNYLHDLIETLFQGNAQVGRKFILEMVQLIHSMTQIKLDLKEK